MFKKSNHFQLPLSSQALPLALTSNDYGNYVSNRFREILTYENF